jgi:RNA-directed DNA polymerase
MGLIRDLSIALEMPEDDISKIIATAPRRYKVFAIPKRSGVDQRIIAQPARELKAIQRYVITTKLHGLRVHPIATAYRVGRNIADNAMPHAKKRVILKLDFQDFFHSITPDDLQATLTRANFGVIASEDRHLLNLIFFGITLYKGAAAYLLGLHHLLTSQMWSWSRWIASFRRSQRSAPLRARDTQTTLQFRVIR